MLNFLAKDDAADADDDENENERMSEREGERQGGGGNEAACNQCNKKKTRCQEYEKRTKKTGRGTNYKLVS